jgi:hypothetical protein
MVTKLAESPDLPAREFAERLHSVLDSTEGFPPKHRGRQAALAKMFKVSGTAAFKWLSGKNFPEQYLMTEFESKLRISAAWLWTGNGPRELGVRNHSAGVMPVNPAGTSYAPPRAAKVLSAISDAVSAGKLTDSDLEMLHSLVVRLQARGIRTSDLAEELALLTPEQTRLDDLYRQAGAFAPEQIMLLAKQLEAEAQRRRGQPQGTGKAHGREAGTG